MLQSCSAFYAIHITQTQETMFYHISIHKKNNKNILNEFQGAWKCGKTLPQVFDAPFQSKLLISNVCLWNNCKIFYNIHMSPHDDTRNLTLFHIRTSKKEHTSGSSAPFSSAEGKATPSTPTGKTLFRPAPPLDFF